MRENEVLTREETISVIEGRPKAGRVPVNIHFWVHTNKFGNQRNAVEQVLARYPEDIQVQSIANPAVYDAPEGSPGYRWVNWDDPYKNSTVGLDAHIAMRDWERIDEVLDNFPDPDFEDLFDGFEKPDGRYRLGHWWYGLFERHWSLRGMTNALTDYYTDPENVHRLFRALTDFYLRVITRMSEQQKCDGIWFSDDLGTQTGPFFSPELFRAFFKPYYHEILSRCHDLGMHAWLHACGNIEVFLPDLIEIGLDVVHPIQKHAMEAPAVVERFGEELTFFAGLDVQRVIPWGTPDEVRREVRYLLDTFWRNGRCMLTAGNGINEDCPVANLEAFFEEAVEYGTVCARRDR